jgi:hypothetical protein
MRYLALIMVVLAAAGVGSCGCQCGKTSGGIKTPDPVRDPVSLEVGVERKSYALLEPVVMTLKVTNMTAREIVLKFNDSQKYDFIVRKGKEVVWQWSSGRMFTMALTSETLGIMETITYEVTWDQSGVENMRPPLGAYTVQGVVTTRPEIVSDLYEFYLVD